MINEIDNFPLFKSTKKKIPNRQDLRDLNQIRNWVQHKAVEPESSTMDSWEVFTHQILVHLFKEYFEEDFDKISSIAFINDFRLKKILTASEEKIIKKENTSIVNYAKLAFEYGANSLESFFPTRNFSPFFDAFSRKLSNKSTID